MGALAQPIHIFPLERPPKIVPMASLYVSLRAYRYRLVSDKLNIPPVGQLLSWLSPSSRQYFLYLLKEA